jgi:hypothetical protein
VDSHDHPTHPTQPPWSAPAPQAQPPAPPASGKSRSTVLLIVGVLVAVVAAAVVGFLVLSDDDPCDGTSDEAYSSCVDNYVAIAQEESKATSILDYIATKRNLDWMSDDDVLINVGLICASMDFDGLLQEEAVFNLSQTYNPPVDSLELVPLGIAATEVVCTDLASR